MPAQLPHAAAFPLRNNTKGIGTDVWALLFHTGTEVSFTITASNTGPVRLKNITLDIPTWATLSNCTPALAGPIEVHGSMVCYATYTFTQARYEQGQLDFNVSAVATQLHTVVKSGVATVSTTYTQQLQYYPGDCTLPESRKSMPIRQLTIQCVC